MHSSKQEAAKISISLIMEMVVVKTFDNYFSANILQSRLQHEGIQSFLKDEYTVTIDPILSNAIGGIKLIVRKEDEQKTMDVLVAIEKEFLNTVECPECNANNIVLVPRQSPQNVITAIFTWLFSSYAVTIENVYQCQNCGYESKVLPENKTPYN